MKTTVLLFFFVTTSIVYGQKKSHFLSFGLDYRGYPIDIEDVPRGGYSSNGLPDDSKFWQVTNLYGRVGIKLEKNFYLSLASYTRYNHLTWLQGDNLASPVTYKRKEKKNFKFDAFLDIEKKMPLKKNKERYFVALAGIGFTNINTRFDVFLQDTLPSGPTQGRRYQGNFLHFTPRVSLGYQYEKIKLTIDTYFIEGPDLTNLTSLWIGGTVSYEIALKKKNKQ